ncbi:hypothetical protein AYI68_g4907 [Smittium mucronatum]|uniref:Uncharacterized protein n=1 Tax=Smittium mucronatum TaxID=133383 RepID=A0A1R0GVW3_9FUNG|nr:hypothetical protein AYI68_g4907 [Smittium mucronatum]
MTTRNEDSGITSSSNIPSIEDYPKSINKIYEDFAAQKIQLNEFKLLHKKATRALVLGRYSNAWDAFIQLEKNISACEPPIDSQNPSTTSNHSTDLQNNQHTFSKKVWILYVCIISSMVKEVTPSGDFKIYSKSSDSHSLSNFPKNSQQVWVSLKSGYYNVAGNVDPEIIVLL